MSPSRHRAVSQERSWIRGSAHKHSMAHLMQVAVIEVRRRQPLFQENSLKSHPAVLDQRKIAAETFKRDHKDVLSNLPIWTVCVSVCEQDKPYSKQPGCWSASDNLQNQGPGSSHDLQQSVKKR